MSALRMWGLAAATLAAGGLLVADSAAPSCKVYQGFQVEYDWSTDCMTGQTQAGHVALSLPDLDDSRGDSPALVAQAAAGGLVLTALWVDYDEHGCTEADGSRGTGTPVGLDFVVSRGSPVTSEDYCQRAVLTATDQSLGCSTGSSSVAACTLTLHRTSP